MQYAHGVCGLARAGFLSGSALSYSRFEALGFQDCLFCMALLRCDGPSLIIRFSHDRLKAEGSYMRPCFSRQSNLHRASERPRASKPP